MSWQDQFPWTAAVLGFLWPDGPARRKRWMKIAVAVLIVVALHAVASACQARRAARAAAPFAARWGALDLLAHAPPRVPDEDNQARVVRAAAELVALSERAEASPWREYGNGKERPLTEEQREAIRGVVADNTVALGVLDLAAERTRANWDLHYAWGPSMDVPPMLRILNLARLNAAAGRLALERGEVDEAVLAVQRAAAIGTSLSQEPVLLVQLVRLSLGRMQLDLCRRILSSAELRPEQVDALKQAVPDFNPRRSLQEAMAGETKAWRAVVRGWEALPAAAGRPGEPSVLWIEPLRVVLRPLLLNEERVWFEVMTSRIEALAEPRHSRGPVREPRAHFWNVLVRPLVSFEAGITDRVDVAESRQSLARLALAVERHRLASGRPPATLDELGVEKVLDPLTGRPFRYETDGSSWHLRSEFDIRATGETITRHDPVLVWARRSPSASTPPTRR